ncbi:hypothetical protein [Parasitella parasitica]|uniref:Blue light receptor n=1 Tax=Parasitella parasitica TaxID=35722 RepID=A0A0B7N0A8_9FUNG|nr:hypothetical protein [Parasitella parasitica]
MDVNSSQQVVKLNLNSSVSEFTRRKNWSTSILDCLRDVVHVLNNDLRFVYCSAASSEFLGYKPSELVNHAFTEYLHVDDIDMFVREFRNCKTSTQTFKCSYRFLRKDGKYTTLETNGTFYRDCLFGNARKVPSDNARSIDLFLDLKMENELLQKKLALLKNQHHQRETSANSDQTISSTSMTTGNDEGDDSSDDFDDYNISANAPNVYTLGVNSSYDINESLALFTGLRYDLGERSSGISLGLEGGQLTNVDVDKIMSNPIIVSNNDEKPMERTKSFSDKPRPSKKKRVDNPEVPKICTDCGTTDAPEWRRGPSGPKTLCNACGLRWSKTKKKLEAV